ncbi:hypothetical protein MHBO_005155, partial [Bonamia ostreae]
MAKIDNMMLCFFCIRDYKHKKRKRVEAAKNDFEAKIKRAKEKAVLLSAENKSKSKHNLFLDKKIRIKVPEELSEIVKRDDLVEELEKRFEEYKLKEDNFSVLSRIFYSRNLESESDIDLETFNGLRSCY